MIDVTLFGKEDCHLCDDVEAMLGLLEEQFPHRLKKVDITGDRDIFDRYRYLIPVVRVGGRELVAPIRAPALQEALRAASTVS